MRVGNTRWKHRTSSIQRKTIRVGLEPTRGDPIGLAGRRLNRSAKVSLTRRTDTQLFADGAYSLPHPHNFMQDSSVATPTCFMLLLAWAIYCSCFCLDGRLFRSMCLQYMFSCQLVAQWGKRHLWDSSPRGETPSA